MPDKTTVQSSLEDIFCEHLGVDRSLLTRDATLDDDLGIDSLDTVELVINIEDEFGITISDDEAESFKTFGMVIDYVAEHAP